MLVAPARDETLTRADIKRLRKERVQRQRRKTDEPRPEPKKVEVERQRAKALLDGSNSVPPKPRDYSHLKPVKRGEVRNPLGVNGTKHDVAALARVYTGEALTALVRMLSNDRHAVAAAVAILDRGYGKPQQTVENNVNITVRADELSDDELARLVGVGASRQVKTIEGNANPAPQTLPSREAVDVRPNDVKDLG